MTFDEAVKAGHRYIRKPFWNEHAFIELDLLPDGKVGPWGTLHDVGGYRKKFMMFDPTVSAGEWEATTPPTNGGDK